MQYTPAHFVVKNVGNVEVLKISVSSVSNRRHKGQGRENIYTVRFCATTPVQYGDEVISSSGTGLGTRRKRRRVSMFHEGTGPNLLH